MADDEERLKLHDRDWNIDSQLSDQTSRARLFQATTNIGNNSRLCA